MGESSYASIGGYSGLSVVTASAWTPASLPNLVAWYDASDLATITESGGAVSQINDKSGNNNHLTQSVAGRKPTTGSRTQNSLNVLDCDGGDLLLAPSMAALAKPLTVLFLLKLDVVAQKSVIGKFFAVDIGINGSAGRYLYAQTGNAFNGTAGTSWENWCAVHTGTASYLRVNGSNGATANAGTADLRGGFDVFANGSQGNSPDGAIAELAFCSVALGSTDLTSWDSYITAKWAV